MVTVVQSAAFALIGKMLKWQSYTTITTNLFRNSVKL